MFPHRKTYSHTVSWRFNGDPVAEGTKYQIGDFSADNFGELTVFDLDFFDRGTYECNITNVHASQSCEATLDVQGTYVCTPLN